MRPRPKVQGSIYQTASLKNRDLGGGGGAPKKLRSGAMEAMRQMASRKASERMMRDMQNEADEGVQE